MTNKQKIELIFRDGEKIAGLSFGFPVSVSGELVFTTGMTGYPESLTDPSYNGQILMMSYPLVGSYGVPPKQFWESDRIQAAGLIVSRYIDTPSHWQSKKTLAEWLIEEKIPALEIPDTRYLVKKLRDQGNQTVKILANGKSVDWLDAEKYNPLPEVSTDKIMKEGNGGKTVVLIDCGAKENIKRSLLKRKVKLITVPWDHDIFSLKESIDGVVVSNGPGDPKKAAATIQTVKKILSEKIPLLGICLGNQILALAAGGDTYKMKFGHRGQNQPCLEKGSERCYLTTQNHGYAVKKLPAGFVPWFINVNDGTNEGIRHKSQPFMSVQFHPEAMPGPDDTGWIFDNFLKEI